MRHRRTISLYDTEPSHEEVLVYLEGIEGRSRQGNALLQMLLVGFRVIANQESGSEAYFRVRNPDLPGNVSQRAHGGAKSKKTLGLTVSGVKLSQIVPQSSADSPQRPSRGALFDITPHDPESTTSASQESSEGDVVDVGDEHDTLKMLQFLSDGGAK